MIVELVGLSGSGKTFLAPQLARRYDVQLIRVGRLGQRHLYAGLFALTHLRLYCALRRIAAEQSRANKPLKRIHRHRLTSALAKSQKARLLRRGVVDEGLLQFLLAGYERAVLSEEVEAILSMVPAGNLCICFVQTDDATRASRLQARNKVPRAELGPDYQASWQAVQTANLALLQRLCVARFECHTIRNA